LEQEATGQWMGLWLEALKWSKQMEQNESDILLRVRVKKRCKMKSEKGKEINFLWFNTKQKRDHDVLLKWRISRDWWHVVDVAWLMTCCGYRVTDDMLWMSRDWCHVVDVAWLMTCCGCRMTDDMLWMSRDMWPYIIKRRSSVHESFLNNYEWCNCCDYWLIEFLPTARHDEPCLCSYNVFEEWKRL
jgi:hypothetical protein